MKIVNASPITQGVLKEVLTYYTSKDIQNNSLVVIPLRGKSVPGLVTSFEDANEAKSRLKSSRFTLKRVEKIAERILYFRNLLRRQMKRQNFMHLPLAVLFQD